MNKLISAIVAVTFSSGTAFAQAPASAPAKQEKVTVPDVKVHATPIVKPVAEPKAAVKEPAKPDVKLELKPEGNDLKKIGAHAHKKADAAVEKKVEEIKMAPVK